MKDQPERGNIKDAAAIYGLPLRTVQSMAKNGEIPGAAKFGRRWTFDLGKVRRHVRLKEQETWRNANQRPHRDAIGGAIPCGAGLRSMAATSDGRFTQVTRRLRGRGEAPVKTD